ncbi:response regulator [Pseudanabaena biceps]|nr:response regulator [Pseudanabaena biceps]
MSHAARVSLRTIQILRQSHNIHESLQDICGEVLELSNVLPNIICVAFFKLDSLCKLSELEPRQTNSHLQGKIIAEAIASNVANISSINESSQSLIPNNFEYSLENILLDSGDLADFASLPQIFEDNPYFIVPIVLKAPETCLWGFMILRQRSPLGWEQEIVETLQLAAMQVAFALEQEQIKANLSRHSEDAENAYTNIFRWMEQYRSLVEQIPNVTYVLPIANTTEFAQKFSFISPQINNLLGITHSFWQDNFLHGWVDYVHPEDRQGFQKQIQHTIATGEECNCEYRMLTAEGKVVWVRDNVRVGLAIDNQTPILLGSLFNISDRKVIELALRESEARLEEAQRISKIGHWEWHILRDEISWSSELFRIFDLDPAFGTPNYDAYLQLMTLDSQKRLDEAVQLTISQGKSYHMELELARSDSAKPSRYIEAIGHAEYNQNEEISRLYGTAQDISDRKNMEAKLAEARIAEEANQAKSRFLAVMSHEIRTPMNAVIGMTEILQTTSLTPQQQDYVATIKNSGEILLSIINNVLDLSKIESGAMQIDASPFALSQCIEEVLDLMAAKVFGKHLELFALINCHLPQQIIGDYGRLRQVLVNLVSNAIKFTECGEIVISVNARSLPKFSTDVDSVSWYELLFEVRDTGVGISAEAISRLFQNFSQADISISRQYGGTGLGLAICKQLCELMGGDIAVQSEVGIGSTFSFSIRVQAIADVENTPTSNGNAIAPQIAMQHILLIHPSQTCQIAIAQYLHPLNIELQFAQNLNQAFHLLQTTQRFDVVIIDLDTSEFNGLELAQDIQGVLPDLKLIALSSIPTVVETNYFAAQLTKPISSNKLYRALSDSYANPILSINSIPHNTYLSSTEFSKNHPLRILIAEDNPVNKKVLLLMLESLGYHAKAVTNGAEAVKAIDETSYDVVFMDIQMPIMDGLTATKQIRQRSDRQPWIIGLSANAFEEAHKDAQLAGMDEYITKPLQSDNLTQVLQKVTRSQGANFTISQPNKASLDIKTLNNLADSIGFENLANLIQDYLAESAKAIAKIQTAFASLDIQTVDFENHALKGGSASFGAMKMFEICSKIKSLCKIVLSSTSESSQALLEMEQALQNISTEYDALVKALQVYISR